MISKNQLKTRITNLFEGKAELQTPNGTIIVPSSCIPASKKIGDEITLYFTDQQQDQNQTEAHYQAMKKILRELVQ